MKFSAVAPNSIFGALILALTMPDMALALPAGRSLAQRDVVESAVAGDLADYAAAAPVAVHDSAIKKRGSPSRSPTPPASDWTKKAGLQRGKPNPESPFTTITNPANGQEQLKYRPDKSVDGHMHVEEVNKDTSQGTKTKDVIGKEYEHTSGKPLSSLNSVNFRYVSEPDSVKAGQAAMKAAGVKGDTHEFKPGQPGWDELQKGHKVMNLGGKVVPNKQITSAKIHGMEDEGDHNLHVNLGPKTS